MSIRVYNRSTNTVMYSIPEMHIHREFNIGETKNVELEELNALYQKPGGKSLITDYLIVEDKDWVEENIHPEIEYWWKPEDVKNCVLNDSIELFSETLDYAPEGVIDYIKYFSYKLPLTDLNKISVIQDKLGFDVITVTKLMSSNNQQEKPQPQTRRRRES